MSLSHFPADLLFEKANHDIKHPLQTIWVGGGDKSIVRIEEGGLLQNGISKAIWPSFILHYQLYPVADDRVDDNVEDIWVYLFP